MWDRNSAVWAATALLAGSLSLGGCATKKFVRQSVEPVSAQVQTHETRLAGLDKTAADAMARAEAAGKLAEGKFLYSMVLSDDGVRFRTDKYDLSPEAQARLQQLVDKLKAENKNVYVEVQGHTDATGPTDYNYRLGEERADAVRRYLNQQGVALNRIGAVSYGKDLPTAPNNTRAGRAQNRRVVVIVMS
jgi:outer membrane protein OmpA-like peptidoglycan-associated protein